VSSSLLSYNGHEFSDRCDVSFSLVNVYDDDDTTVVARRLHLIVKDYIMPDSDVTCDNNEAQVDAMKATLMQPARNLKIQKYGFGTDFNINDHTDPYSRWDIRSGPKPRRCEIDAVGHNSVSHIVWELETVFGPCGNRSPGSPDLDEGLVAFNYTSSKHVNIRGYQRISINGYVLIAQRQDTNNNLLYSSEDWEEWVINRFDSNFDNNMAKEHSFTPGGTDLSRLNFTLTYTEHETPNAFPAGVVDIKAPFHTSFKWPMASTSETSMSLNLSVELEGKQPRVRAWEIFEAIFNWRFNKFFTEGEHLIVSDLDVTEDPFTEHYHFGVRCFTAMPYSRAFELTNMFQPNLGTNWQDWHESMEHVKQAGGHRQIIVHEVPYKKLNLCDNIDESLEVVGLEAVEPEDKLLYRVCASRPSPEASWTDVESYLIEAPQVETGYETTYGQATVTQAEFSESDDGETGDGLLINVADEDYDHCFSQGPPVQRWIWQGRAQRVGYPIPPISKVEIGGQTATVVGEPMFYCRCVGHILCLPVYEAAWNVGLIVTSKPSVSAKDETDPTRNVARGEEEPG
jgi:hypothetical protein